MKTLGLILGIVVLGLVAWSTAAVVVSEGEQAVITEFGNPRRDITSAGLYWKTPFVQNVTYFDKKLLLYDAKETDIVTRDKKTLRVDNYARWRIVEPLKFIASVRSEAGAQQVLDDIVYSELRVQLGLYDLIDVVASSREKIHIAVTQAADAKARQFGIEIVDVRIKRADLPQENQSAVFERMKSERQRQATQYKSEGAEEAAKIKAETDKQKAILLADAYQKSQTTRGQGDAEAIQIYNEALGQDPEFYAFIRSLETYRKSFTGGKAQIIISPDSELFKYFKASR